MRLGNIKDHDDHDKQMQTKPGS